LRDYIVKLNNLPERTKIKGVLQVLGPFGIELAEQARSVELAERLDLLNGSNLVVESCGIVDAGESFGFELFFETSLLLALV
jgi:hypothetical protein